MKITALNYLFIIWLGLVLATDLAARDYSPLLTGELYSRTAQDIFVPHATRWRTTISMMAGEGQEVRPGDVVVAFDGTDTMRELERLHEQRLAQETVTDRDLAKLDMELTQARFAVDQASVALDLATLKAEIPLGLIGALEHSENQLSKEKGTKLLKDNSHQLTVRLQAFEARQQQAELDRRKAQLSEAWWTEMLEKLSVEATQNGFVIHGYHPWTRAKFQEGDSVRTSFRVAEVADTKDLAIRVWVNGVDRPHIKAGMPVTITFDAIPKKSIAGHLAAMSDSAARRQEWGKASYYEGTVSFDPEQIPGLLPGMSALVELRQ